MTATSGIDDPAPRRAYGIVMIVRHGVVLVGPADDPADVAATATRLGDAPVVAWLPADDPLGPAWVRLRRVAETAPERPHSCGVPLPMVGPFDTEAVLAKAIADLRRSVE